MTALNFCSATSIARAIREKQVSSFEVVAAHVSRIQEINGRLNAVVPLAADWALRDARDADQCLAKGTIHGPLHGVPVTIKDSFDTAGIISTGGTRGRAAFVPAQDATAVSRLRSAGAILLGKTNTSDLTALGAAGTDNAVYGRTNNPYDLARSPSGSSGGAAAIVAAAGSALDLASDMAGSIREPCHVCGVAGLKPTAGRVPRTGHVIPYGLGAQDALLHVGPIARFVEDLHLALVCMQGIDWHDPAIVPMPLGHPSDVSLKSLRVAFYTHNGTSMPLPEIARVIESAAAALAAAVAAVEPSLPPKVAEAGELYRKLRFADGLRWIRRLLRDTGTREADSPFAPMLAAAVPLGGSEFSEILERVDAFRASMIAFMRHYDAVLCPVVPYVAQPHEATSVDDYAAWSDLCAANLTGFPAAVVRAGASSGGLPIGVQIVGRPWRDDVVLALAMHIEESLGGYKPPVL